MELSENELDRARRTQRGKVLVSPGDASLETSGTQQLWRRNAHSESHEAVSEAGRIARLLRASNEQLSAIDRVLAGEGISEGAREKEPLLIGMGAGARLLGVSRATFWRMLRAKRLEKVEVLPGSYRVRRRDVEAIAG
ncbi:MAG TPA: helix-turn-helix domain-containing protein [Verrucomicrobiae bacterium]|nr:helix-turn-helix domain-containing protein [Verrucomicrobiae bacterium]